jgi:hypothetical protein
MADGMKPQSAAVLRLLERGPVTQQDAIKAIACYRLAARISDLRADGFPIASESVTVDGHTFARYRLAGPVQAELGL